MATFIPRDIPPELWQKVQQQRYSGETPPLSWRSLALRLWQLYADHGLAALERTATANRNTEIAHQ
jgi:hypothetical protein